MIWHSRSPYSRPSLNLALQGGGAHGAFTWGVLDALLEANRFTLSAISGASAGALNAALLANGLTAGGPIAAREGLERFWTKLGSCLPLEYITVLQDGVPTFNPMGKLLLRWSRELSPYEINPAGLDPLRDVLAQEIDFERLRSSSQPRLFVSATHACSGRLRLFSNNDLSLEALCASACLPTLHHAKIIDGEPYWDGGYSANPAILPLLSTPGHASDTLLVLLAPRIHARTPYNAEEIRERMVDIAFQATFLREIETIQALQEAAASRRWMRTGLDRQLTHARWHLLDGAEKLAPLDKESRLIAHLPFLLRLRDSGRTAAQAWLEKHGDKVGRHSSTTLEQVLTG